MCNKQVSGNNSQVKARQATIQQISSVKQHEIGKRCQYGKSVRTLENI